MPKNSKKSGKALANNDRAFECGAMAALESIFTNAKPGTKFTVGSSANIGNSPEVKELRVLAEKANLQAAKQKGV